MLETPHQPRRCQRFCTDGAALLRQPRRCQRFCTDGPALLQHSFVHNIARGVTPATLKPTFRHRRGRARTRAKVASEPTTLPQTPRQPRPRQRYRRARPCSFRRHGSAIVRHPCEGDEPCRRHNWSSQFCGIARCQSGVSSSSTSLLCKDRSLSASSVSTSTDPSAPASPRLNGARTFTLPVQGFVRIGALGFWKRSRPVKREVLSCETEEHFVSLNRTADD